MPRPRVILEGVRICALGEDVDPVESAVRWDLSAGAGPEEPSNPDNHLPKPFRWLIASKVSVIIDQGESGDAILEIDYRSPVRDQAALVRVNGQTGGRIEFPDASFQGTARAEHRVTLKRGQNIVEFEFETALKRGEGEVDLFLLVEDLTIAEVVKPAEAELTGHAASPQWECISGFSRLEEPSGENGLFRPFRWALEGESTIRLAQPVKRFKLLVRNNFAGQVLDIFTDKAELVCTAILTADLLKLQEIVVDLSGLPTNSLSIRPHVVEAGSPDDPRRLCYILEAISDEKGELLRGT